jgi:hypothetical protein
MPRCPLCGSALVTITFGLYPIAFCTSCSARWTINQVREPSLMAQRNSQPDSHARSQRSGQLLPGGSPW